MVPNLKDQTIILDVGGNVDCKPIHLVQFALMGSVFSAQMFGKKSPRVGLLSNGEEESKGNELTRLANLKLKETSLNYAGYTEGRDIYNGKVDVVVVASVAAVHQCSGQADTSQSQQRPAELVVEIQGRTVKLLGIIKVPEVGLNVAPHVVEKRHLRSGPASV